VRLVRLVLGSRMGIDLDLGLGWSSRSWKQVEFVVQSLVVDRSCQNFDRSCQHFGCSCQCFEFVVQLFVVDRSCRNFGRSCQCFEFVVQLLVVDRYFRCSVRWFRCSDRWFRCSDRWFQSFERQLRLCSMHLECFGSLNRMQGRQGHLKEQSLYQMSQSLC
jgi:hypothetical protein